MINRTGDVFTTDATYIGHGVNCKGVMGAGIAKRFRDEFPLNYAEYRRTCDIEVNFTKLFLPGSYLTFFENEKVIVNFATQHNPGPDAKYPWIFTSFYRWADKASRPERIEKYGNKIAIPEIGCGIGGLEVKNLHNIVLTIEGIFPDIVFEVWKYA